jgi:hypothetical protein
VTVTRDVIAAVGATRTKPVRYYEGNLVKITEAEDNLLSACDSAPSSKDVGGLVRTIQEGQKMQASVILLDRAAKLTKRLKAEITLMQEMTNLEGKRPLQRRKDLKPLLEAMKAAHIAGVSSSLPGEVQMAGGAAGGAGAGGAEGKGGDAGDGDAEGGAASAEGGEGGEGGGEGGGATEGKESKEGGAGEGDAAAADGKTAEEAAPETKGEAKEGSGGDEGKAGTTEEEGKETPEGEDAKSGEEGDGGDGEQDVSAEEEEAPKGPPPALTVLAEAEQVHASCEAEVTLFGALSLCENIECGSKANASEIRRLDIAVSIGERSFADPTMLAACSALAMRLHAEVEMQVMTGERRVTSRTLHTAIPEKSRGVLCLF